MATTTYVPIANYTFAAENSSYTFSSIPSTYSDLIVVVRGKITTGLNTITARYNGDTGSNYYYTRIYSGDTDDVIRTDSTSGADTYAGWGIIGSTEFTTHILQINNYTQTSKGKTGLGRSFAQDYSNYMSAHTNYWNNTSVINSITISNSSANNFAIGTTFALYGIADASIGAPKATGGIITQDSTYFYHTFGASGTFTPQQSLTADILVVAGGGGGGSNLASGGGAGGLLGFASQSLSATGYAVTVGSGGNGAANGSSNPGSVGGDSQFGALTLVKGGGYGGGYGSQNGGPGGSGGGGSSSGAGSGGTGGSPTSGQGYAGGSWISGYTAGGGGGAGAAGTNGTGVLGAAGGVGSSAYSSWGLVTGTGQNVSGTVYYAGGGGGTGNASTDATNIGFGGYGGGGLGAPANGNIGVAGGNGLTNTGGGGGGGGTGAGAGGKGGSGVVIIRYLKA